jgi:hypothetical protein
MKLNGRFNDSAPLPLDGPLLAGKQQLTALLGLSDDETWLLSAARGR